MRLLVATLFVAFVAIANFSSFGLEPGQRGQRPPNNIGNALDALGLMQPESVRSILLLYSGKSLLKAKAEELEAALRKEPDKIESRVLLIGYYTWNGHSASDRLRLRAHVLWMIENHPEHAATAEPSLRDLPDDPEGNVQILEIWNKHLQSRSDDLAVLKNAEKFYFGKDPAEADRLIHRISAREPNNREWPAELAQLYRMFGIPGENIENPGERAVEEYRRVLELTKNPAARLALSGEMADAAFKIGDFPAAAQLAKIYLDSSDRPAVQRANTILGRVALRTGDIANAKQYLLDSAADGAARDIAFSGPTLVLAKEMIDHGERDVVVEYLEHCLVLWPRGESVLRIWIADIKNGKTPKFGGS
jgi:tetratricopeptide (TPR) repeat protein